MGIPSARADILTTTMWLSWQYYVILYLMVGNMEQVHLPGYDCLYEEC